MSGQLQSSSHEQLERLRSSKPTLPSNRRRHVHHVSLPNNQLAFGSNSSVASLSRQLSPFEERFLGRPTHSNAIPLAEPVAAAPTATERLLNSVKRAMLKKQVREITHERAEGAYVFLQHQTEDEVSTRANPLTSTSIISHSSPGSGTMLTAAPIKRSRSLHSQTIITAHRSPFGGYTKSGDFVMTRTTDGTRLPAPQPHPHSLATGGHISIPAIPMQPSALKKGSVRSFESGDSYTLVPTPESVSSAGSLNGASLVKKSMFAKLVGRAHKSASSMGSAKEEELLKTVTKKAVRFSEDSP